MMQWVGIAFLPLILGLPVTATAAVISIDLNDFYADPTVTVAPDGVSALLEEDPIYSTVWLSNDPGSGDPGVTVPANLQSLIFDYTLTEPLGSGNDDEFYAWVFDGDTGTFIDEFFVDATESSSVVWDLSNLSGSVTLLGVEFQLNAYLGDAGLNSTVEVSNVRLVTNDVVQAPVPGVLSLFAAGFIGIWWTGATRFLRPFRRWGTKSAQRSPL